VDPTFGQGRRAVIASPRCRDSDDAGPDHRVLQADQQLHLRAISAPFGRTSVHPMRMDLSDGTKQQIERLRTALPET
jgi:hypothetical protein